MGEYKKKRYFGVVWTVFVVETKADGLAAITRGEKAVKFAWKECQLEQNDTKEIAAELRKSSTLLLLDFFGNDYNGGVGPEGAKSIADALKVNKSLQSLDLGCTAIGPEGAESIANALKVNKTLETLSLRLNGPEEAKSIADSLKVNKTLHILDLSNNNIGPEGAKSIAGALEVNRTLQILSLQYNSIRNEGAKSIADALKVNKTLQILELGSNSIDIEGSVSLAACARSKVMGVNYDDARVKAAKAHGEEARRLGLTPQNVVPREILDRDSFREATNTIAYLQGILYSEATVHQLKVLLVGPQQVGKTTLRRALKSKGKTADPTKHDDVERATISVDEDKITFEPFGVSEKGGEISLWDFGGQEEYYMTHSFFLSNRSLVMVVVDLEAFEDTDDSFERSAGKWLRALQMQIFRPKVLLVGTKSDTQTQNQIDTKLTSLVRRVDELGLKVRNAIADAAKGKSMEQLELERLNGFEGLIFTEPRAFAVSGKDVTCADGVENLYSLLRDLASNTNLGVALRVPKTFEDLRSVIKEKLDRDGAYIQDLNVLQRDAGLEGQDVMFRLALGLMHDLGIILWYEKNIQLCEFVFADPSWVVDIVRQVFRHDLFVRREGPNPKGVLYDLQAPRELCELLKEKCVLDEQLLRYFPVWKNLAEKMFERCVVLLQQFELMFKLFSPNDTKDHHNRYMIPLFLQDGFLNEKGRTARLPTFSRSESMRESLGRLRNSLTKTSFVESAVEVNFLAFLPDGLLYRLIARTFWIVDFPKFTANSAKAVYSSNGETVDIKIKLKRKIDGTGMLLISCRGESVDAEQLRVLERTRNLLSNEVDQLMQGSFRFVPYSLNLSTTHPSKNGRRFAESTKSRKASLLDEGFDFSYFQKKEIAVRMLLKAKDPYRVKKLFFDEIQHQLEMDDQKTEYLIKVGRDILGKLKQTFQLSQSSLVDGDPLKCDSRLVEGTMVNRGDDMSLNDAREFLKLVMALSTRVRTKFDCFMSHKWGKDGTNHNLVKELVGFLSSRGLKCWLDDDHIQDNISEMLRGIQDSQVFVACITDDYIDDVRKGDRSNCGKEFLEAGSKASDDKIPFFMKDDLADDDVLSLLPGFGKKRYFFRQSDLFGRILKQLFPYDDPERRSVLLSLYTDSNGLKS